MTRLLGPGLIVVLYAWALWKSKHVRRWSADLLKWLGNLAVAAMAAGWKAAARRWWGKEDPPFSGPQRAEIMRRAGWQCEHVSYDEELRLWVRCPAVHDVKMGAILEADHIIPRAKRGRSVVENGQALCRPHNRTKSDRVPSASYLARLHASRQTYYPKPVPQVRIPRRLREEVAA